MPNDFFNAIRKEVSNDIANAWKKLPSDIANVWKAFTTENADAWRASTLCWVMRKFGWEIGDFSGLPNDRKTLLQDATRLHKLAGGVVIFATLGGLLFGIVAGLCSMLLLALTQVARADGLVDFLNAVAGQLAKLGAGGFGEALRSTAPKMSVDSSYIGIVGLAVMACSMVGGFVFGMLRARQLKAMATLTLAVARIESKIEALETRGEGASFSATRYDAWPGVNWVLTKADGTGQADFGNRSCAQGETTTLTITHRVGTPGVQEFLGCEEHRQVSWTVNGNGTVTSVHDRLMWIQAPWGMEWQGGAAFSGEPLPLTWHDATRLFGKGTYVASASRTMALSARELRDTTWEAGYTSGTCRVSFAGFHDWRLPTVAEWHTILDLGWDKSEGVFPRYKRDERFWTANGEYKPKPFFRYAGAAWTADISRWISDAEPKERYPVMFVRRI